MMRWIEQFKEADPKTKSFIFNWFIYGLALVLTTVYCYSRINYARGDQKPAQTTSEVKSK